ncbi:class I SAM-dependent methyltransferase [Solirubrobacter deserti]|uniref:Methyltransferase domain-containing protein n=1 Tax=Solirubrobacter deserti TaxID=2282478 RepID=A0ABT4RCD1_9ACTN|nr:methyltransferase domain-containing protein [Solirubrobacter deserti]MDA0136189.1 methyltransferase domain-containing protein [Solirubrobacter deserti]
MRDGYAHLPQSTPRVSRRDLLRLGRGPLFRDDIDYDGAALRVLQEWSSSDRAALLRALEPVASALVECAGVQPGWRVLDAAAGDGNVALAAVAAGAEVEACDVSPEMVARGRARVAGAARFSLADVQALTYPDGSFDAVISAFGFALAPRALRTARELVRVCKPGGVVALAAWCPRGLPGELFEHLPRPTGVVSPGMWGVEDRVRTRLEPLLDDLVIRTRAVSLEFDTADALFAQLTDDEHARPAFDRLLASCNDRPPSAVVSGRYVLVTGVRA